MLIAGVERVLTARSAFLMLQSSSNRGDELRAYRN